MGEILSHAEVEAILSAIEPSRPEARPTSTASAADPAVWERHDFRRPEVLHGAVLNVVHALHGGICRRWEDRLQSLLQEPIAVRPVGACQSTGAEFLASITSPHVMCQIGHTGTTAESLLAWSAELVQSLVARMLGSTTVHGSESTVHPLTNIELRLLTRLNDAVLGELAALLDTPLRVTAVIQDTAAVSERNAQFPSIWFSFEVDGCGSSGLIHMGIPSVSLTRPGNPVEPQSSSSLAAIPFGIQQVAVQASASLASLRISTSDLAALQVGDIVMTDLSPRETVSLQLNGRNLCQATIGTHLGRKALRLAESPPRAGN